MKGLNAKPFSHEAVRQKLLSGRESLQRRYHENGNGTALLRDHSRLVDRILRQVWHEMNMPGSIALLSVGGYGRRQLFPYSDIDLVVLLPDKGNAAEAMNDGLETRLEHWVGLLWDIGLDIGHSVRTVAECGEEAANDITVQTSLLEARLLVGNLNLFDRFLQVMEAMLAPRKFFVDKQFEQQQRHKRYQDAPYKLEPNIKEGPGGLRDLQNVLWISRAAGFGKTWSELAKKGYITHREARLIQRQQAVLQDLRIRLHYLGGRREDRLLFDYQNPLAEELGIAGKPPRRPGEMLMQRYYRAARSVTQVNTILLLTLHAEIFPDEEAVTTIINERFQKRGNLLEIRDEDIFERDPGTILESVLLLQQNPDLKGRSFATLRAMWRSARLITASFHREPRHCAMFMEILRQPRGLTRELRLMNRYGILGRYIPAFGRIVGQMQHDLFHVYTVDEHILMVVRNLRRFMAPEFAYEYPLCSRLINEFERPELLYLAGLFHDIAKGRQGDHSLLGKIDARRFCERHRIPAEDTELVVWLVENHLRMSATAQKKDIADTDVIADFATSMRDERHLIALYLLTVADIRGTSPKVWNAWKGKLLEDLFHRTRQYLCGETALTDISLENRKNKVLQLLHPDDAAMRAYERLWSGLDSSYLMMHDPREIAWHTQHLSQRMKSPTPVVKTRAAETGAGVEVLVYTADQKDLFARICSFFDRIDYNIVQAKIHTTREGYALDSFLVLDPFNVANHDPREFQFIEQELTQQLEQQALLAPPVKGRLSRHLRHFPITPQVSIEPDDSGAYYVLSITAGDQPGLLSRIAQVLVRFGLNVHSARINTLGERAEDTFLITGSILSDSRSVIQLEANLIKVLHTSPQPEAGKAPGKPSAEDRIIPP
ncbi:UTP--GlnB (protein PII) uridylyltransferase, GlnD [Nitrosospira multiformis]|uniref:Bifunctional uridylyltransferase/uridylyl-removing enzyme n=1 Tax=Nitrosospira multiformis TaxID=1231 RepID=A0A1H8KSI3_9PROT|nr:[protein-PII] uridylyltransferase [Nitrosospira multiformis]SEN95862.1 UTP--GlnB (protein PII) uridylyltransferase, GlnD [Nitrosospira multiformis]